MTLLTISLTSVYAFGVGYHGRDLMDRNPHDKKTAFFSSLLWPLAVAMTLWQKR